jgi:hypothetical protein
MSSEKQTLDPLAPLARLAGSVGRFWMGRSGLVQILLVLGLLVAKNGFDVELRNIQEAYLPASLDFPSPNGYWSASFGQVAVTSLLGLSTTTQWVAFHGLATVLVLICACWLAVRSQRTERSMALLIVASATASSTLLIGIGKYDVFTVLGAFILILARSLPGSFVGSLIMTSGNPEQAMVAAAGLLAVSFAPQLRDFRLRAVVALATSAVGWVAVQVWFAQNDLGSGRLHLIRVFLGESLGRFAGSPELSLWSWFGAGWIVVLVTLVLIGRGSRWPLALGLIAIPGIASISTADGARVFAAVALPSFVATGLWLAANRIAVSRFRDEAVGAFVVLLVILPTALTGPGWFFSQVLGRFVGFFATS